MAQNCPALREKDGISSERRARLIDQLELQLAARQQLSRPLAVNLHNWLQEERTKLSRHTKAAKAINCMFEKDGRWQASTAFLDDGRICLTQDAAERALRGVAVGRKSWLLADSERGGERAAVESSLIVTAKMNDIDPRAGLADVLAQLPDIPVSHLLELLPWNLKARPIAKAE